MGGSTVEHRIPRNEAASRESEYENCLYACRFCNRSRSAKPVWHGSARLLDPTADAWADHFVPAGDDLVPAPGDPNAAYTHRAYEIDDPRKVARRRARRELIADRLKLLARLASEVAELLRLADSLRLRDTQRFGELLQEIKTILADSRRALQDLARYAAIPTDAPRTCRCPAPRAFALPREFESQTSELPDSVVGATVRSP